MEMRYIKRAYEARGADLGGMRDTGGSKLGEARSRINNSRAKLHAHSRELLRTVLQVLEFAGVSKCESAGEIFRNSCAASELRFAAARGCRTVRLAARQATARPLLPARGTRAQFAGQGQCERVEKNRIFREATARASQSRQLAALGQGDLRPAA